MKLTYLLINLGSILIPFIFSFHPKLRFDKVWKAFWPACIISAILFCVWDMYYTDLGVWGFNEKYITGIHIFNLPLEEVLFFICIPYSSVFTYHCFQMMMKQDLFKKYENAISLFLIISLSVLGIIFFKTLYTGVTFLSLSIFLIALKYFWRVNYLSRFYFMYLIILLPFFIVNGMLTGTGLEEAIVWYDDSQNLGIRMLSIPVEDTFYGMLLILLNVSLFEFFKTKIS